MTSAAVLNQSYSQLIAACEVQQQFLEHRAPALDTLSYSARCRQMDEVGGDCYVFVPLSADRLAFAIADASGKGLPAALMISNVQSSLRTAALFVEHDAPAIVEAVNRQLCAAAPAGKYATLFYGVFDAATSTLRYVNAGHNPPMIVRRNSLVEWLEAGGVPVGMFADASYLAGSVQLERGDLLVAYTDGVVEAVNPDGEEWGVDGLRGAVANGPTRCADGVVDAIFTGMYGFSRGHQTDDATVVVLQVR